MTHPNANKDTAIEDFKKSFISSEQDAVHELFRYIKHVEHLIKKTIENIMPNLKRNISDINNPHVTPYIEQMEETFNQNTDELINSLKQNIADMAQKLEQNQNRLDSYIKNVEDIKNILQNLIPDIENIKSSMHRNLNSYVENVYIENIVKDLNKAIRSIENIFQKFSQDIVILQQIVKDLNKNMENSDETQVARTANKIRIANVIAFIFVGLVVAVITSIVGPLVVDHFQSSSAYPNNDISTPITEEDNISTEYREETEYQSDIYDQYSYDENESYENVEDVSLAETENEDSSLMSSDENDILLGETEHSNSTYTNTTDVPLLENNQQNNHNEENTGNGSNNVSLTNNNNSTDTTENITDVPLLENNRQNTGTNINDNSDTMYQQITCWGHGGCWCSQCMLQRQLAGYELIFITDDGFAVWAREGDYYTFDDSSSVTQEANDGIWCSVHGWDWCGCVQLSDETNAITNPIIELEWGVIGTSGRFYPRHNTFDRSYTNQEEYLDSLGTYKGDWFHPHSQPNEQWASRTDYANSRDFPISR